MGLEAAVSDRVRPGVVASPNDRWNKLRGGRNIYRTTSDALGDMEEKSIIQSNTNWLRLAEKGIFWQRRQVIL